MIEGILELERQNEIEAFLTLGYVKQLRKLADHLEDVMNAERSSHARNMLYRQFLPDEIGIQILTNERIQAWQDEAATFVQG